MKQMHRLIAERDALRADLAAATQRAKAAEAECDEWQQNYAALEAVSLASERERQAAEAALAVVPVEAIRTVFAVAEFPFGYINERNAVNAWLDSQPEVQP